MTEPSIDFVAQEFTSGNTTTADTWYYYDIPTSDDYEFTSSAAATLTFTTDGTQLTSSATGTDEAFTAAQTKTIAMTAGRVYFKTSAATTLSIAYKYNIGSATADYSYVQGGETVTISWASAATNDPDATFAKNGTPGITFNGSAVEIETTTTGFTFTVPSGLTANTAYTLAIPANAFGYAVGTTYNAAQNITLNTPALFDGTYYFRVASTYDGTSTGTSAAVGKYLSRGCSYSTHTTVDNYGLAVDVTTDGNNVTNFKMSDTQGYFKHVGDWDSYTDGGAGDAVAHTVMLVDDVYRIKCNATDAYFKYNTSNVSNEEIPVFDDGTGTNNGPIINWAIETVSAHATAMQAKKDAQAASAAAAAYASGNYDSLNGISTVAALESELTTNYIDGEFVSPTAINSVQESYQPRNNTSENTVPITVYSNTINITEPGFYKFSMQAFNRATWNENVQALHEAGADMPAAVLFFGDSETQIKSLYDEVGHDTAVEGANPADASYGGKYYANSMTSALKMFKDDKYHNDVWFYASTAGTYTYGVKIMGYASGQWFIYSPESVTVTSYAAAASAADYTALSDAIDAYDAAEWGFEKDEYAPYNNVTAIKNIEAAKAIDSDAQNSKLLVNSLTTAITLSSANDTEVNAISNGTLSGLSAATIQASSYNGWTSSGDAGIREIWTNTESYPGLTDASNNTCLYVWSSQTYTYGNTTGYTMPLKANTIYEFSIKFAGQTGALSNLNASILNESTGMAAQSIGSATSGINTAHSLVSYTIKFVTGEAGNYVLSLTPSGNAVFTDMTIYKAANQYLEFADGSVPTYAPGTYPTVKITRTLTADRWATAVYPFAVSGVDNIAVLNSYDASTGALGFTSAAASTANVPFLMKSTTAKNEISLSNVAVAAASATDATVSEASLKGVYASTDITSAEKNYVLSNNTIYPVGAAGATINPYRAYIQIDQAGESRNLTFFVDGEEATAIENVSDEPSTANPYYDLSGRRVVKPTKGLYIVNGKKVMVK